MWNIRLLLTSIFVLIAPAAFAAENPVIFQRDVVTYVPVTPVEVIEEAPAEGEEEAEPEPPREAFDIDVEIRPQDALRLEWIHTLNNLKDKQGVMIVLSEAMQIPLMPLQVFTPLDVIVIDERGAVSQLIPNVVLATLGEDIVASRPTRAFLYMRAGSIAANRMQPADMVDHPYFTPQQTVLQ